MPYTPKVHGSRRFIDGPAGNRTATRYDELWSDTVGLPMNTDDWRNDDTAALFDAIITLDTRDDTARFFRDLCTRRELEELSSRWAVVRLLNDDLPYRMIHELTGVSTATITRINQWLQHGTGGYTAMLSRLGLARADRTDSGSDGTGTGRPHPGAAGDVAGGTP